MYIGNRKKLGPRAGSPKGDPIEPRCVAPVQTAVAGFFAIWIVLLLASPTSLLAQAITGSILGVVTDLSGAVVPGAAITVINAATGESRTARTSTSGEYSVPSLPPGEYRIVVEFKGFKRFERSPIRVDVLHDVRVDVALTPGDVTEAVQVTAETPLLETASAALGGIVDNRKIIDLPLRACLEIS